MSIRTIRERWLHRPRFFTTMYWNRRPGLRHMRSSTRAASSPAFRIRACSMASNGQFRTRLGGALADGGECYISTSGVLEFYAPYPPQLNEEVVVAYRS